MYVQYLLNELLYDVLMFVVVCAGRCVGSGWVDGRMCMYVWR